MTTAQIAHSHDKKEMLCTLRLETRFNVKTSRGNSGYYIDGRVHAVIMTYLPAAGGNVGGMHWQVSEIKELLCYFKLAQLYI
jgi:hypothetical protein